jgi:Skp family chaperone for outer membrane proteins
MASTSPSKTPLRPARRRQRSVRVTVAVALLSFATLVVVLALPTGSFAWMAAASVFALVCAWASARILYNELAQSRRDNFADRAAQADAYRTMFSTRAEEHAEFASVMTDKLAQTDREVRELSGTLVLAEKRAAEAEHRVKREAQRASTLESKVTELEEELDIRRAEEEDQLAVWDAAQFQLPGMGDDLDTVVDLLAWEERVNAETAPPKESKKHA